MTGSPTAATLTRRPAGAADDVLVRQLVAQARPELSFLDPPVRDQLLDLQLRAQRREYAEAYPGARDEILVVNGVDVGRLVLAVTPETVRVVDIAVLLEHRGRGVGTTVLREVIHEAERDGRSVTLSVWSGNGAARRLYRSLGFVIAEAVPGAQRGYVEMSRSSDG